MKIGIDLGGSKIEVAALDENGDFVYRYRVPTPNDDYNQLLQVLIEQIIRCEKTCHLSVDTVGICIPGAPEAGHGGAIKNANLQILNGKLLKRDLESASDKTFKLINDANSFVWSEFVDGAAKHAKSCFGVILGTGCGGGVIANEHLLSGANSIAGEWGHNPLPEYDCNIDGPEERCYCGRMRCIESFLSGTAFSNRFNMKYKTHFSSEELVSMARRNDETALKHFNLYCDQMARALGSVINLLDPDVIVLGGGMSNIDELYAVVPPLWHQYVFTTHGQVRTRLLKALHGDSSGVRGAAWL